MSEQSLKQQTIRGVGWSFADSMLGQGITFLVGLVLARLLSPDEYGLIGIISIFIYLFDAIVDSGFSKALIRKTDANDTDYNTMFIVNLVVSIILFGTMYISSPLIAKFFERPELLNLCRVMGIVVIINALAIVQNTILSKKLDFKTKTKASFISSISSGIIGILMAFNGYGVWSLVGQQVSRQLLNTLFLWIFNKWRPRLCFSWNSFQEMWQFGWKLLLSSMIDQTWTQIYQVVIGKCYLPASLGQYTRAQQFASIFSSNLTSIVQRVSYPALSKLQDDHERLKLGYKRIIKITMLITFTLMLGLAGCAKSLILVLIGEKWTECALMLQIVCFSMMLYPLHALNLNMLQVQGRSDLFLKLEIIKKIVALGPILMGIFIGIYYMLLGSVASSLIALYLNAYYSGPLLKYNIWEQAIDVLPSLAMSLFMFIILIGISYIPLSPYLILLSQILTGAGIIITICELWKPEAYSEIKDIVKHVIFKLMQ